MLWIDLVFGKVGLKIYYGISKIFNDAYYINISTLFLFKTFITISCFLKNYLMYY